MFICSFTTMVALTCTFYPRATGPQPTYPLTHPPASPLSPVLPGTLLHKCLQLFHLGVFSVRLLWVFEFASWPPSLPQHISLTSLSLPLHSKTKPPSSFPRPSPPGLRPSVPQRPSPVSACICSVSLSSGYPPRPTNIQSPRPNYHCSRHDSTARPITITGVIVQWEEHWPRTTQDTYWPRVPRNSISSSVTWVQWPLPDSLKYCKDQVR